MKKLLRRDNNVKVEVETVRFTELLFLLFLGLKLGNVIDWSWWWVFAPLWIPLVGVVALLLIAGLIALIVVVSRKVAE